MNVLEECTHSKKLSLLKDTVIVFAAERSYIYIYILFLKNKQTTTKNQTQVPRTNSLDSLRPQNKVYHLAKTTDVFLFFFFFLHRCKCHAK